jgi:hypothetical protein
LSSDQSLNWCPTTSTKPAARVRWMIESLNGAMATSGKSVTMSIRMTHPNRDRSLANHLRLMSDANFLKFHHASLSKKPYFLSVKNYSEA